ncbi:hypothetical protein B0H66DRAFT_534858 [Apodospora peruviana]|uniref:Uncharacterized protein n=1 Tax=Apodospora peruviana TaxID=516989 RepID=A0AAE0M3J1_9PEZI|nr:hypothetical protein B0H66DRAFT_534858 [Apodospora peruviana]
MEQPSVLLLNSPIPPTFQHSFQCPLSHLHHHFSQVFKPWYLLSKIINPKHPVDLYHKIEVPHEYTRVPTPIQRCRNTMALEQYTLDKALQSILKVLTWWFRRYGMIDLDPLLKLVMLVSLMNTIVRRLVPMIRELPSYWDRDTNPLGLQWEARHLIRHVMSPALVAKISEMFSQAHESRDVVDLSRCLAQTCSWIQTAPPTPRSKGSCQREEPTYRVSGGKCSASYRNMKKPIAEEALRRGHCGGGIAEEALDDSNA